MPGFGLTNYLPPQEEEFQPPPDEMQPFAGGNLQDLLGTAVPLPGESGPFTFSPPSPSPTSFSGGKKGGPSNWWFAAAAPIIAMLGSKLSGGKDKGGVDFNEALAQLGTGFGAEKLRQMTQRRQQEFEQENATMELAHKAVSQLHTLDPASMAKYPKLQELASKYSEALADDGKVSPKEAGEIVQYFQIAQHDMEKAQREQTVGRESEDTRRRALEAPGNVRDARMEDINRDLAIEASASGEMGPPDPAAQRYVEEFGTIPLNIDGQTVRMSRKEAVPYKRMENQQQRQKETMELLRQRIGLQREGLGIARQSLGLRETDMYLGQAGALARTLLQQDSDISPAEVVDIVESMMKGGLGNPEKMGARPRVGAEGAPPSPSPGAHPRWQLEQVQ
jgi:hypothetical protein